VDFVFFWPVCDETILRRCDDSNQLRSDDHQEEKAENFRGK
jgi:hypothetical protein